MLLFGIRINLDYRIKNRKNLTDFVLNEAIVYLCTSYLIRQLHAVISFALQESKNMSYLELFGNKFTGMVSWLIDMVTFNVEWNQNWFYGLIMPSR